MVHRWPFLSRQHVDNSRAFVSTLETKHTATLQHCNTATLQHCNTATLQHCNTATQLAIIHEDDAKSTQQLFTMCEGAGVSQSLTRVCLCVWSDGVACTDLDAMKHDGALNELDEQYRSTSRRDFSVLTGSYPSSLISSRSPSPSALENPVSAAAKRYGCTPPHQC